MGYCRPDLHNPACAAELFCRNKQWRRSGERQLLYNARNRSDRYIFLMAGEALGGAKQDRMVSDDVLLPTHSRVEIAVWCVEHGRWTGEKEFRGSAFTAPPAVRKRAIASKNQSEVWDSVAEMQRATGAPEGCVS